MADYIAGVLIFVIVVTLWALIGHGLWLLAAWFFSAIADDSSISQRPMPPEPLARFTLADELQATLKQLDRLWRRGLLSDEEHARLRAACQHDLDRLRGKLPPSPGVQAVTSVSEQATSPSEIQYVEPALEVATTIEESPAEALIIEAEVVEEPRLRLPHPLDRPDAPAAPRPAEAPRARRALADVLAAFMQERNIRWGELVSGLLIVGSAAGLVLSLREQLKEWIPYFPALLFLLGTAAFHGVGLYTLQRWNLRSTSRGVLLITQLLVPVNFLAAVLIASGEGERMPVTSLAYMAAVTIGLVAYGLITYTGARALLTRGWSAIVLAVMGASGSQLYINRLASQSPTQIQTLALALAPALAFVLALAMLILTGRRWRTLSLRRAQPLLMTLGLGSFALAMPLALLIAKAADRWEVVGQLAPVFVILAATLLATGNFIAQRTSGRSLAMLSTTGVALAILGGVLMLVSVGLAWPDPRQLILVGTLCTAALALQAMIGHLPLLVAPATASGALTVLISFHAWQGRLVGETNLELGKRILQSWLMGRSALLLTALAICCGAVALVGLRWMGQRLSAVWQQPEQWPRSHALMLLAGALVLAFLGMGIAAVSGFTGGADAELATLVFALDATVLIALAASVLRRQVTYAAVALTLLTIVHALGFNPVFMQALRSQGWLPLRPVLLGVLVHANLAMLGALLARWQATKQASTTRRGIMHAIGEPLAWSALIGSLLGAAFAVFVLNQQFGHHAGYTLLVATAWLGTAIVLLRAEILTAAQAMLSLCVTYAVLAICQRQPWWGELPFDPRAVYSVVAALAIFSTAWLLLRIFAPRRAAWEALLSPAWPGCEELVLLLSVGVIALPAASAWLGVREELRLGGSQTLSDSWWLFQSLAHHSLAWLALASISVGLGVAYYRRAALEWIVALLVLACAPALLIAGELHDVLASASALRWLLAGYLLIAVGAICARRYLTALLACIPGISRASLPEFAANVTTGIALLLGAVPILGLTITACTLAASGIAPRGPLEDTFFAELGWTVSYVVPLAAIVVSLWALGLRERQPSFVMAGSLVWQLMATLACVMPVLTSGGTFDTLLGVQLLQFNALGLASYALLWLTCDPWLHLRDSDAPPVETLAAESWLTLQLGWMLAAVAALALWSAGLIIGIQPPRGSDIIAELGRPLSFVTLGLAAIAATWFGGRRAQRHLLALVLAVLTAAVPLIAAALAHTSVTQPWFSYHALLSGWYLVAALATLLAAWLFAAATTASDSVPSNNWLHELMSASARTAAQWFASVLMLVIFICNFGSGWRDPAPLWPLMMGGGLLGLLLILGVSSRREGFAYASLAVALCAASQAWFHFWPAGNHPSTPLVAVNLIAAVCVVAWWLWVAIYRERTSSRPPARNLLAPFPLTLPPLLTVGYLLFVAFCLANALLWGHTALGAFTLSRPIHLLLAAMLGCLLVGSFWYDRQRSAIACLYAWGLASSVLWCDRIAPDRDWLLVYAMLSVAGFVALSGLLWQAGAWWSLLGQQLQVHYPIAALERTARWLPWVTVAIASLISLLDLIIVLNFEIRLARGLAGFGPMLLAIGLANLAQQERRPLMIYLALLAVTYSTILLSWAEMPPSATAFAWLLRNIRVLVVLGIGTLVYGALLPRVWEHLEDWRRAVRQMALTCAAGGAVALIAVLVGETFAFEPGVDSLLPLPQVLVVAGVLIAFAGGLIALAVSPALAERRGWNTSEPFRMGYVYAAQIVLALAFGHLYLTRPTWFDGLLRPYWPFVVMALAFAGVGLGEMFQRYKLRVLAEPLGRTGALLPLLPALGWWIESLRGEPATDYALVMFVVGLLYVLYSFCRTSTLSAIAAGLAGNIALWALLAEREGFALVDHPQFWLIPPAISVLAAVQFNHRRLREEQLTAVRYLCMLVIYLSSTAEIFITGIGESTWPPLMLLGIAVLGVLAGIALQIRAFLYVGTSFVFLSLVTMVWHASKAFDKVWLWWAFGIFVGLAMLVFFGLFEKKRPEITAMVERLRQWEH